jgi:hypothetical protein
MIKYISVLLLLCGTLYAGSTNVKIVQQRKLDLSTLVNQQIGIRSILDTALGFRMWGGKDSSGVVTYWLAKDKKARLDTTWMKASYSARDTSVFHKSDSSHNTAGRNDRSYFGVQKGDTSFTVYDTSKIVKTDSVNVAGILICKDIKLPDSTCGLILKTKNGTTRKYWRIQIDSTGAISADSTGLN